ncbi:hypothetical protein QQF64_015133 [Cirrhinus molitorella]|uniref:Uncharacterized protein n=1 Tax=Cirrhinus molitorella TaxID=172907 RepID=A0ABR3NU31_9TELE
MGKSVSEETFASQQVGRFKCRYRSSVAGPSVPFRAFQAYRDERRTLWPRPTSQAGYLAAIFDEMPQTWAHVRRWAAFASGYTESKHCSSVSGEWDWALIYGSCPGALGYRQLDFWQFIEWLHDLATQWTDSQSASVTAEFIKRLLGGKKDPVFVQNSTQTHNACPYLLAQCHRFAERTTSNGKHRTEGAADLRAPVYFHHPSSKPDTRFLGNRIDGTGAVGVVKF